ncbi:class I SAM-dependent methyltransferase [Spirulina major]|uniref:class I SAM-dependent methyltransferase n=1 Tax=Spirulina major TaxID=270636 RepID=UPI000A012A1A|nr:class I SAM-dependent methyltransferase [Spirulina major]
MATQFINPFINILQAGLPTREAFGQAAYTTFQYGKSAISLAHKTVGDRIVDWFLGDQRPATQRLSPELLQTLQKRQQDLLEEDWQDAQAGLYPETLLFETAWDDVVRYYPQVWIDWLTVVERRRNQEKHTFAPEVDRDRYPAYYLQNFHYQTDGYLSEQSANLYDLQVEILFNGAANPMRRRVLKPLKQGIATQFEAIAPADLKILDVACGTGYTLQALRATFPQAALYGVDLSPAYLRKANQILSAQPGELPQLIQAPAEALPYQDNYVHGLTSVFLFHELPGAVRQAAIAEMFRVLKPGGTVVLCDSVQMMDIEGFGPMLENFPALFHEPYYRHYCQDDLVAHLEQVGFTNVTTTTHHVSKYWLAHKPS